MIIFIYTVKNCVNLEGFTPLHLKVLNYLFYNVAQFRHKKWHYNKILANLHIFQSKIKKSDVEYVDENVILPCLFLLCSTVGLGLWVIDNFGVEVNRHFTNVIKMNKSL